MKNLYALIFFFANSFSSKAEFGIYATAVYLNINGTSSFYNNLAPGNGQNIGNASYQGGNFGTFAQNDGSFVLSGAEIKTYKGAGDNVCSGTLYFTVYPAQQRPQSPAFQAIGLGFYANCTEPVCGNFPNAFSQEKGGGCCNPGDQKWQYPGGGSGGGNPGNIDLTTYAPGNYTLELYYQITGQDNGAGCSTVRYDGNNSNPTNYTASFSISPNLPVHFGGISVVGVSTFNRITWTTLTEQNTRRFVIERSADGNRFEPIGELQAAGNSNIKRHYVFEDKQPLSTFNFYRVQMVEHNNLQSYSSIVWIKKGENNGKAFIYPNPARNNLRVFLPGPVLAVSIFEPSGRMIFRQKHAGQVIQIPVAGWPPGKYYAVVEDGSNRTVLPVMVGH